MERIEGLMAQIKDLESHIDAELAARRAQFRYRMEAGKAVFEEDVLRRHRALRVRFWVFLRRTRPLVVLTAPFIYSVIIGFVVLDVLASLYQAICFPVYGIRKVRRGDYIIFDRHHLAYLNAFQKFNCLYCAYGNGLMAYVGEIAGRTEQYWCPIKHARRAKATHSRYALFLEFGEGESFETGQAALRGKLEKERKGAL